MNDRYRECIAALPIPTAEQTDNFAAFVVGAHSWYKHLPPCPPGVAFVFFLDPNSGCDEIALVNGRLAYRDRVEDSRFHDNGIPTTEYRARFGHWAYATDRGWRFIVTPPGSRETQRMGSQNAWIAASNGAPVPVSPGLLAVGTVHLTGHVHENFIPAMVGALARRYQRFMKERTGPIDPKDMEWHREQQGYVDLWEQHQDDLPGFERELAAERARLRAEVRATLESARAWLANR